MNTLLDLCPEYNHKTLKWEVRETDENDNTIEVYDFDSEDVADAFVEFWIEDRDNKKAGL